MAIAQRQARPQQVYMGQQQMGRGGPSGLADVLEVLLDKGLVVDAFVRVSLIGIELLTIDARVVVASVDTYLRFAEAVNRLDLLQVNNSQNLGDLIGPSGGRGSRALEARGSRSDEAEEDGDRQPAASSADDDDSEEPSAEGATDERSSDDGHDDGRDDKGILTRIKERGQVF